MRIPEFPLPALLALALGLLGPALPLAAAEAKSPPPKGTKKSAPAAEPKTGSNGAPAKDGKPSSGNLAIPPGLDEASRTLLVDAVEAFEFAEKASAEKAKGREKAVATAIAKLKTAVAKAPEIPMPLFYLARAHELKRNFPEARKTYEKALKLNPRFHEALSELAGIHYYQDKDRKKALELFDRAVRIQPSYVPALQGRAWTLLALGDLTGARDQLSAVIKLQPDPDLKKVIEKLDKDIRGPGWTTAYTKETENYIVITQVSQEYAEEIAAHAELIRRAYNKIFSDIPKPERKYPIIVYRDRAAYLQGGAPPQSAGYYDLLVRKLVMYRQNPAKDTLNTLYHEAFHQYLQDYQEQAPQWFNEGLGDYFGAYRYERQGKREFMRSQPAQDRLGYVQAAIERKLCPPASELMVMSQAEMYAPAMIGVHYSQAWAMIYFMIEGKKPVYKNALMSYFRALQKGMDIREAYAATFGKLDMQKFDAEWKSFTMGLGVKTD